MQINAFELSCCSYLQLLACVIAQLLFPPDVSDLPLLLVMEFVEKGSLHSYLQTNKKQLDLTDARLKLLQIGTDIAEVSYGTKVDA